MPEPASWKALFDRRRWRQPGYPAQQLRLLGLLLLTLTAAGQVFSLSRAARIDLSDVLKTIGQGTAWRSANYGYSKNLADFTHFLHKYIPKEARVIWPAPESGSSLPGATPMQVLLFPRRLVQCPPSGCTGTNLSERTYFVTTGDFPGNEIESQAAGQQMFNQRWGVLTFDQAGFQENPLPSQFSSIAQAMLSAFPPLLWMLLLTASGTMALLRLLPRGDLYMKVALGFGLGSGMFTILASLAMLAGISLRAHVVAGITAVLMATGACLVALPWSHRGSGQKTSLHKSPDRAKLDGWVLAYLGLACVAALVAAGKGFRVSDELLIWAPKGYGIAAAGSLESVTDWGTNTLPYPLQVPILIAAFNLLFSDILPAAKLIFSAYYLAVLVLAYSYLTQKGVRGYVAGCCSLLVATSPLIFRHATIAYANLPFTFNLVAAVLLLTDKVEHPGESTARLTYLLSGLFFLLAAWTRPEGVWMAWLLIASLVIIIQLKRKSIDWRGWAWVVTPMVFYQVFWRWVSDSAYRIGIERSQLGLQALKAILGGNLHLHEAAYLLTSGVSRLLDYETWGFWGAGLILATAAGIFLLIRRKGEINLALVGGWLVLGMIFVMYYIVSYDQNHDVSWWVSTGLERMMFPGVIVIWLGGIQLVNGVVNKTPTRLDTR